MIDELDGVRDALEAIDAPVIGLDALKQRRMHHVRTVRIGAGFAVAAAIAIAAVVAVNTLGDKDGTQPADRLEGGALRHPGEVLIVKSQGADEDGVYARVQGHDELRPLVLMNTITAGATPGTPMLGRAEWSTDGDRMAFHVDAMSFNDDHCSSAAGLWVVDASGPHQLTHECADDTTYRRPLRGPWMWIPGTSTIALIDNDAGDDEHPRAALELIDATGGDRRTLAGQPGYISALTSSPDGHTVFWINSPDDGQSNVYAADIDDDTTAELAKLDANFWDLAISPDGSKLAVTGDRVRILTTDGAYVAEADIGESNNSPAWSADSSMLAWIRFPQEIGGGSHLLYVWRTELAPTDPDAIRRLDRGQAGASNVTWSTHGTTVAYVATIDNFDGRTAWKAYDAVTGVQVMAFDGDIGRTWQGGASDD